MATTGKFNGDLLVISADGTVIAHSQDATLSISQDLPDSTTKDSNAWVQHIHGNRSWEMSCTGLVTYDASMAPDDLADFITNQSDINVRFSTSVVGDIEWRGQASVSSFSENAPQNAPVSFDCSFTGNGALTKFTVT